MKFTPAAIDGAFIVDIDKREDDRGFFARIFCQHELEQCGMNSHVAQANLSHNAQAGTLRGMHYQIEPAPETKLIRCVSGSLLDIIVDMRPESPTYLSHVAVTLSAENARALFVPACCAHGFLTLEPNTDALYMVSGFYDPACERGLRYNDPNLNLPWPENPLHLSEKDQQWPLLDSGVMAP